MSGGRVAGGSLAFVALVGLVTALAPVAACRHDPPAKSAPPPAPSAEPVSPADAGTADDGPAVSRIQLDFDDATLGDVLAGLARATSAHLALEVDAGPILACVRTTVRAEGDAEAVTARVADEAATWGIDVVRRGDELWARRSADAGASPCGDGGFARRAKVAAAVDAGATKGPAAAPVGSSPHAAAATPPGEIETEILAGITEVSPTIHALTPAARDLVVQNADRILEKVRMVPELGDAGVGLRLLGVAPDGVAGKLGFRTGDLVRGVDGVPFAELEAITGAFGRLRRANRAQIQVVRAGAPVELVFRVVATR